MDKNTDILHEAKRLRLLAAALELQHYTSTAANVVEIPGGDRVIAIGTPAEVCALLACGAARDVLAERRRQVEAEGWTPEHDDEHGECSMSYAAACYALADTPAARAQTVVIQKLWEWTGWSWFAWWKPKDRRRNLVRAAALLLAEIERIDRAEKGGAA